MAEEVNSDYKFIIAEFAFFIQVVIEYVLLSVTSGTLTPMEGIIFWKIYEEQE